MNRNLCIPYYELQRTKTDRWLHWRKMQVTSPVTRLQPSI